MKKELTFATLIFIGFFSFLVFEKPLRELLLSFQIDYLTAKYSSGLVVRSLMICLVFLLVKRLRFEKFTGLDTPGNFKNIQAIFIPLAIILVGISNNWRTYINAEVHILFLFVGFVVAVGLLEELVFRGTIFPLCVKAFKNIRRPILIGGILSSLLFGAVHFVNLFSQPDNLAGIISQIFFALSIGVFFCGLMVRSQNILIPAIIHALVNFSFGAGELNTAVGDISIINSGEGMNWNSIIPTAIFFSFIFIGGVYMILNCDEKGIMEKLEIDVLINEV